MLTSSYTHVVQLLSFRITGLDLYIVGVWCLYEMEKKQEKA